MYNQDLKRKWDNEAAYANSIEEAMAKGRHERELEIAAEMKLDGMSVEKIAKFTKLSVEEIEKL